MPDLLLEVGTEELPSGAVASALEQLRESVETRLREARLGAETVRTYGTPRRLIVVATGLPERQPDVQREQRGPSRTVAFDASGKPTGAAIGFARKQGVPVEDLAVITTPQGEYVVARVTDAGRPAGEVLGELLAESVKGLFFPKMMRWGSGALRFARPVRWIACVLESAPTPATGSSPPTPKLGGVRTEQQQPGTAATESVQADSSAHSTTPTSTVELPQDWGAGGRSLQVVPMEIAGVESGRMSRGHRFLAPAEFEVASVHGFLEQLRSAFVLADPEERESIIRHQIEEQAAAEGGHVPIEETLLDENNWLVEWPTAYAGSFDPAFLELPRPVLVTAMKKHQRFFPVEGADGRLLPRFIAVRNGGDQALDVVREGAERVLVARFNDARYFFEKDRQIPLDRMAEGLRRILFQEKLGTLAEKQRRLEILARCLTETWRPGDEELRLAPRAAALCKADLASQMVTELPALQGIIGEEYALAAGEDPRIARAIGEHYQPRSAGDELPRTDLGRLLAVADRVDTLVGYVGLGILPSGSSDPYGLRRAAHGVIQILAESDIASLLELEVHSADAYGEVNGIRFELDPLCNDLGALFSQRIAAYLEDKGVRYDLIDAALSGGPIYTTLVSAVVQRAMTLQSLASDADFVATATVAGRVANILRGSKDAPAAPPVPGKQGIHGAAVRTVERAVSVLQTEARQVDPSLFAEDSERALFDAANRLIPDVSRRAAEYDFQGIYRSFGPLRPVVDRFFDDVLVMVEDVAVRRNRLAVVAFVDALYKTLADFTKVVV